MAGITQAVCTSFKVELMTASHNFTTSTGHTFKIALFDPAIATLSAATSGYSTTGEVTGTGYLAGGNTLVNVTPTSPSGTTAITTFNSPTYTTTWSTSTITAGGALIYNSTTSPGNRSVVVLSFGGNKTSTAGDFSVVFPAFDITNAIIRIA